MASLLLGRQPPRASARDLVRWCGLFDVAPGTARVALHRMVRAGELTRSGTDYELSGRLAGRQVEQEASLAPRVRAWRGHWRMAVVAGDRRSASERADLRERLRRSRLAEWREGVWLRPDNLGDVVEDARCAWVDARPEGDPVVLAGRLFAPEAWSARARRLLGELDDATQRLADGDHNAVADAFVVGAAALRHVRADPLLPEALVAQPWPAHDLRDAYVAYQRAFTVSAREWFRA